MTTLSSTQKCTLRADMDTHPELTAAIVAEDVAAIAVYYNTDSAGGELCWRSFVSIDEIWNSMDWTEYQALSRSVQATFELLTQFGNLATGQENVRDGLAQIFAGPGQVNTRTALIAVAQRIMTRGELLFADTTNSPATLVVEGAISNSDVLWALDNC